MLIGIDLDNTIICYDGIFYAMAQERELIPEGLPPTKQAVRDHLRITGQEHIWTEMQGIVYGPGLERAGAFPGVWEFMRMCGDRGITIKIVSHRTRHPYEGPACDLHASALAWLSRNMADNGVPFRPAEDIFLEPTKRDKLLRIKALSCDWFIDDLPEFLAEPDFPAGVGRILFDPSGTNSAPPFVRRTASWDEILRGFFGPKAWTGDTAAP